MQRMLLTFALLLHANASQAQVNAQIDISVSVEGDSLVLPTGVEIEPASLLSYNLMLQVTLENLVRALEDRAAQELRGDARFRGLEMRPWGDGGLSIKVLLRLSCFGSNASVRARLQPIVTERSVSFAVANVEVNVSNDLCRLAGDVAGVTGGIRRDIERALTGALSEPFWLDDLPPPYSTLPLSLTSIQFLGADRSLAAVIEGHLGKRGDE